MKKIVVSGIGCVSGVGIGYAELKANLLGGASGVRELSLSLMEEDGPDRRMAAEAPELNFKELLPGIDLKATDRATQFVLLAAKLALEHAGLNLEQLDRSKIAVALGTAETGYTSLARFYRDFFERGAWQANPIMFANTPINVPAARVAMYFGLRGPNATISNGQTSSLKALAYGCDLIRLGQADIALVGGVESLSPETYYAYHKLRALTGQKRNGGWRCAPFDAGRNGLALGEGAVVLALQSAERAEATNSPRLIEIAGFGSGWDGPSRVNGRALATAIENALAEAQARPCDVDLALANANGSIAGDRLEAKALRMVFGSHHSELGVSAIKAATGEMRGAAGAMQTAVAAIAIETGQIPPTLNLRAPDKALPPCRISSQSLPRPITTVLINTSEWSADSFSLVVRRCEDLRG